MTKELTMVEKKILVVDDEQAIQTLLKQMFTRSGYEVETASSGEDALAVLEETKIHVMFFDLNLPGLDGIDLCRKVKKQIPTAIIYAITGYASLFELAECREAGFEDYFKKPCNIDMLLKAGQSAFEKLERWKKG